MARAKWRGELRQLRFRIENLEDETLDRAEQIMEAVTRDGAELMQEYIATRGTPESGRPGRIETGTMYREVGHEVHRNPKSVRGEFGWGVGGKNEEHYFTYQENGFRHWLTGKDVPPMHAFLDAFIRMREEFFRRMRREGLGR